MSARKVRRHIRQLKKERRRALRRARREEQAAQKARQRTRQPEPAPEPQPEPMPEPMPEPQPEPQPEPAAHSPHRHQAGVRTVAVMAAVGILAVAGSSVAMNPQGEAAEPGQIAAAAFPAADSGTSSVCPPTPGLPDSLTTDGLLEYRDRDESATARFQALMLSADAEGTFPPGRLLQLGEDGPGDGTTLSEPAESDVADEAAVADPGQPAEDRPALGDLEAIYETSENAAETPSSSLLEVEGLPGGVAGTGAARSTYLAEEGPVTGLATIECSVPQRSQWFFGPEVGAGATSLLTLANPFSRAATVEVTGYDADGHRGSAGTRTLVVPGESVRTVNIAALAGSGSEFAVSVQASGAPVAAQLQSSRAVGLTGEGVDFLPGLARPATEHVMPGVPVPESTEDEPASRPAELWIHAPGNARTTMEVQVFGDDGVELLDNPAVFTVEPGEVDTVDLRGLESGVYDVVVRSDEPTYVAVSSHGPDGGEPAEDAAATDFAWQVGATPLRAGSGLLVPDVGESELRLTGLRSEAQVSYRLLTEDGELSSPEEVTVPAEGAVTLSAEDLGDAVAVVVEEAGPSLYAALTTRDGDRFSLSTVDLLRDSGQSVPVRLRH
ncbi:DUF5719 family protein [Nesterenkonia suensis]